MVRIAQLVLAAVLASGAATAMPGAAAAQNRDWRGVDGNNVTRVRHSAGAFAETAPGRWSEFGPDGRPFHSFEEQGRDAFTVTLLDRSRGTTIVLDLRTREIRGAGLFKRMKLLYTIIDVEGGRRGGRGDRPDDRPDRNAGWARVLAVASEIAAEGRTASAMELGRIVGLDGGHVARLIKRAKADPAKYGAWPFDGKAKAKAREPKANAKVQAIAKERMPHYREVFIDLALRTATFAAMPDPADDLRTTELAQPIPTDLLASLGGEGCGSRIPRRAR